MSRASRASGLLVFACAAASPACAHRPAPVEDGTYLRTHIIAVNPLYLGRTDTAEWQLLPVTDCLRIESDGADALSFELVLVQPNFHSCSASGMARRVADSSSFEAELEIADPEPCHLRIHLETSRVAIEDMDGCRSIYCGAYAGLDAEFVPSSRRTPPVACEEAPMPDLDSAEEVTEELLRGWSPSPDGANRPDSPPGSR